MATFARTTLAIALLALLSAPALAQRSAEMLERPSATTHPVTTVIASTIDRRVELIENGDVTAEGELYLHGSDNALGSHVFVLNGAHDASRGLHWHAISHHHAPGTDPVVRMSDDDFVAHLRTDKGFHRALKPRMHLGMVMIVTDLSLHPDRRSNTDFVIMSSA